MKILLVTFLILAIVLIITGTLAGIFMLAWNSFWFLLGFPTLTFVQSWVMVIFIAVAISTTQPSNQ